MSPASPVPAKRREAVPALDQKAYPWLSDDSVSYPKAIQTLHARFPTPEGFARIKVDEGSLGGWLRELPLTDPETPVRRYDGSTLYEASDPRIAAVIAIDVGKGDLQQCADLVMRFHAEWKWSHGSRDMSYRAASGEMLPFSRWANGERIVPQGQSFSWKSSGSPKATDHASFRKYLDGVFAWANTVSLDKQAKRVRPEDIRPGDFFVTPGNPGHSVIVLDLVKSGTSRMVLLGQSFIPAQSPQVLAHEGKPWFVLDATHDIATPFWRPFPWNTLHRLD